MKRIYNNDLFMNAFNFAAIGMAIVSLEGRWLKVNQSLCKILGYTATELEQMTFQDITQPDDLEMDLKNLHILLNGKSMYYKMEKRYINKTKEIVWGLLSVSLVKDENNQPLYFISQIQDITEQKVLNEKLEKSEERYRSWIQYSPEPMVIHYKGKVMYINEAGVKLVGAKDYKELIGKKVVDFIHPNDKEMVFQRVQQMLTTNQNPEPYDIKLIDVYGKERDVRLSSAPIEYEGKKSIQVVFSDITQQKKVDESIRNNEAQYKSLIEHNPDAVLGLDLEGNFTLINDSCTRITGYSEEEFLGMTFHSLIVDDDLEKALNAFKKALHGELETIDLTINKKNGEKAIINVTSVPIIIHGTILGLYTVAKDVTEKKQIEKELKQSEVRYRALVESSPNSVIVHQEGKIVYSNPKFNSLLRIPFDGAIIGQHITQYVHPDYQGIVKERIRMLERNIPVGSLEEKYVRFDGSIVDVEVFATPIVYMDKPAFQVIIHDISKRKEMERALHKSQEQYRSVVENVKEVIFHTDVQGRWTFLNPAWKEITGYTIKESLRSPFHDYVYHDDREQNDKLFQSLIQGKQKYYQKEIRYVTKAGEYRWVEVSSQVTLNDQGEIIGTLGTLNDITDRKESEEELKVSEERFRLLAEYSSDMITMHDMKGIFLYVSPASKEILQYDEEEIVGKDTLCFIHPEDQEMVKDHYQALLITGYMVSTYRIHRKDGEYVWVESTLKLLDEVYSDEKKLIVVSRNINERKLAEQKLQEANGILQHLSTIDGLTGVSNRRVFDERLEMDWNRGRRNSTSLSLLMMDLDYFKAYNDTYGHQGGDGCLKQVATVINETLGRTTDLLCRYGGEEFGVILPETDEVGAKTVGEKIRNAIEALKIPHAGSNILPWVTISVGTATMIPTMYTSYMDLISNADKALYRAKNDGRNCVRNYK